MCYSDGNVRGGRTKEDCDSSDVLCAIHVNKRMIFICCKLQLSASGKRHSLYNVSLYQKKDSGLVHLH